MKPKKIFLISFLAIFALHFFVWFSEHFHILAFHPVRTYFVHAGYVAVAIFVMVRIRTNLLWKIVLGIATYIFAIVSWIIFIFIMLSIVPGYKERDWVLYGVCSPALEKYHTRKQTNPLDNALHERSTCLQNVWTDRDPLYGFE